MVQFKRVSKGVLLIIALLLLDLFLQVVMMAGPMISPKISYSLISAFVMIAIFAVTMYWLWRKLSKSHSQFQLVKFVKNDYYQIATCFSYLLISNLVINGIQLVVAGKAQNTSNQASLESFMKQPGMLIGMLVLVIVIAPILEEFVFRGVLLTYIIPNQRRVVQIIVSGLLFGAFHVVGQSFQLFALIQYSIMGAVLAYIYTRYQKIQYSIGLHFLNNLIASIGLIMMLFK